MTPRAHSGTRKSAWTCAAQPTFHSPRSGHTAGRSDAVPTKLHQDPLPSRSQNRTPGEGWQGCRPYVDALTWENSVELRGFEPLTPSMRTTGSVVAGGRPGRCAGRLRWLATAWRRRGCCTLVLHTNVLTCKCQLTANGSGRGWPSTVLPAWTRVSVGRWSTSGPQARQRRTVSLGSGEGSVSGEGTARQELLSIVREWPPSTSLAPSIRHPTGTPTAERNRRYVTPAQSRPSWTLP